MTCSTVSLPVRRFLLLAVTLGLLLALMLGMGQTIVAQPAQPSTGDTEADVETTLHTVASGETLWAISNSYATTVDALAQHNGISDPDRIQVGQVLRIPSGPTTDAPATMPVPSSDSTLGQPKADATKADVAPAPSSLLQRLAPKYLEAARVNVRNVNGMQAVVPSPIYANGIYARDAFYAVLGLGDPGLSEAAFRWFEGAQNPATGQITTAVPFDPADTSLQPQDDETALLYLIWAGLLHDAGHPVDRAVVARAWGFVQGHVEDGRYVSPPGEFRYWADCWSPSSPTVIAYNQGYYAMASRFALAMEVDGASTQTVDAAADGYRALYRADLGFMPLSGSGDGNAMQDASALLPEVLHRYLLGEGMLADAFVRATVDHRLATATVRDAAGALAGIKNIAAAAGGFADPTLFGCPSLRRPGDYHNGGYWPMYTLAELALAHRIAPEAGYVAVIEQLVARELETGSSTEYWTLSPGRVGIIEPGRRDYAWNALVEPLFRWSGLIE